jgi:hypothetical protein
MKLILKEALSGVPPNKITNRFDKIGFITPEAYWMKNHNQEFYNKLKEAATVLADIIDKDTVLYNFRKDTEKDSVSKGAFYWRVLSVAFWFKIFNIKLYN